VSAHAHSPSCPFVSSSCAQDVAALVATPSVRSSSGCRVRVEGSEASLTGLCVLAAQLWLPSRLSSQIRLRVGKLSGVAVKRDPIVLPAALARASVDLSREQPSMSEVAARHFKALGEPAGVAVSDIADMIAAMNPEKSPKKLVLPTVSDVERMRDARPDVFGNGASEAVHIAKKVSVTVTWGRPTPSPPSAPGVSLKSAQTITLTPAAELLIVSCVVDGKQRYEARGKVGSHDWLVIAEVTRNGDKEWWATVRAYAKEGGVPTERSSEETLLTTRRFDEAPTPELVLAGLWLRSGGVIRDDRHERRPVPNDRASILVPEGRTGVLTPSGFRPR
jgi:hypothetical protein